MEEVEEKEWEDVAAMMTMAFTSENRFYRNEASSRTLPPRPPPRTRGDTRLLLWGCCPRISCGCCKL